MPLAAVPTVLWCGRVLPCDVLANFVVIVRPKKLPPPARFKELGNCFSCWLVVVAAKGGLPFLVRSLLTGSPSFTIETAPPNLEMVVLRLKKKGG